MRRCHYCDSASGRTIDHIVPKALGGPNTRWNYINACARCNGEKADSWPTCPCGICALAVEMFLWAKERGLTKWPPAVFQNNVEQKARIDLLNETFMTFRERLWEERVERVGRWDDAEWIDSGRVNDLRAEKRDAKRRRIARAIPAKREYMPLPGTPEYYDWYEGREWTKQGFLADDEEPAYRGAGSDTVGETEQEAI